MLQEIFTAKLIGQVITAALMASVAYFARKIVKNQEDLSDVKHMVEDVRKDVVQAKYELKEAKDDLKLHEDLQEKRQEEIARKLEKLDAISSFFRWDGIERRKWCRREVVPPAGFKFKELEEVAVVRRLYNVALLSTLF